MKDQLSDASSFTSRVAVNISPISLSIYMRWSSQVSCIPSQHLFPLLFLLRHFPFLNLFSPFHHVSFVVDVNKDLPHLLPQIQRIFFNHRSKTRHFPDPSARWSSSRLTLKVIHLSFKTVLPCDGIRASRSQALFVHRVRL